MELSYASRIQKIGYVHTYIHQHTYTCMQAEWNGTVRSYVFRIPKNGICTHIHTLTNVNNTHTNTRTYIHTLTHTYTCMQAEWNGTVRSYASGALKNLEKHSRRHWVPSSVGEAGPAAAYMLLPCAHLASMTPEVCVCMYVCMVPIYMISIITMFEQ
jgi:hypothetical protein